MSIGWAPDMIGWACAQPFPTLATPLLVAIRQLLLHALICYTEYQPNYINNIHFN